MIVGQVAIARGPRQPLSYEIPEALRDRAEPGCRVLVPLGRGNRRLTGYLISVREGEAPAFAVKPVSDVLDPEPLFDSEMMSLFGFISRYYHAGLGDVIRTGLPAGLNVTDARVAELTAVGRSRADIDPLLHALSKGPRPVRGLGVPTSRLVRLARAGLLELRYELERPRVAARFTNVVSLTGDEPAAPLKPGAAPARLLELLRNEGPAETRLLRGRVPNHGPAVRRLVALGAAEVERVQVFRDPWRGEEADRDTPPELTHRQRAAVDAISRAIDSRSYEGFLLHGVTGSGKTEVYLHALEHAIRSGRGGIVLVPEIALTPQLAGRFRARFGDQVAVLHSALAEGERLDQWELIRRGERPCVVGARSAIFAPIPDLGVIVVDEEHEGSFKQDESPRYHARDVALKRGFDHGCPVVLGSATPSLETARGAAGGRLTRLDLPERIGDRALPEVELVDLRLHPPVRQDSLLSRPLIEAIAQTVARKEQAIVFLNRRGFANCFMCPPPCGFVPECPQCSVSLTFHRSRRRLTCHYCGHVAPVPAGCPQCKKNTLRQVGTGTEQVEGVLAELVPSARVARMDRDTTRGQALRRLLDRFRAREIDVLVGTQMVAKGHDFPQVTLVGVLLAEQTLKMLDEAVKRIQREKK